MSVWGRSWIRSFAVGGEFGQDRTGATNGRAEGVTGRAILGGYDARGLLVVCSWTHSEHCVREPPSFSSEGSDRISGPTSAISRYNKTNPSSSPVLLTVDLDVTSEQES